MKRLALVSILLAAGCATAPATPPSTPESPQCRPSDTLVNALLWMQTSAEYQAITREIYGTARRTLDEALADPAWSAVTEEPAPAAGLPPAIILDVDETLLDTSPQEVTLVQTNREYTPAYGHEYGLHDVSRPIPAARDFLRWAHDEKHVTIFYVTNRRTDEEPALRATMTKLGYPFDDGRDTMLMRGEQEGWDTSNKSPRRAFVAKSHRVVMLFGDDLNDFIPANGKTLAERQELIDRYDANWGRRWFVIPNPVYGSWEQSMLGDATQSKDPCVRLKRKFDTLRR